MTAIPEPFARTAPAKINLFLHVGDKRADGFHALQSLVAFAGVGDVLHFAPADALSLAIDGPFAAKLADGLAAEADNLVLRAARALQAATRVKAGARIVLTKNLPVASGIGGGSSDAAAALLGLKRLWDAPLPDKALSDIAASLGSDVPVCLAGQDAWMMEGRGEIVTPVDPLPELAMVLVNPGIAVPTAPVFGALKQRRGTGGAHPQRFADGRALVAWLETTANDLEAPARVIAPVIDEVLEALAGQEDILLARMSGSGATCFGLFADDAAATRAARAIAAKHPGWWVAPTRIGAPGVRGA